MAYTDLIPRAAVASSNLASIGYCAERRILAVQFQSGTIMQYPDIDPSVAEAFFAAESKGKFFALRIKGHPGARKMTGKCPSCGAIGILDERCDECAADTVRPVDTRYAQAGAV